MPDDTDGPYDEGPFNRLTPIGLLLKGLDLALTDYVDRTLQRRHALSRFHWQILSTVHDTPGIEARTIGEGARVFYDEARFVELIGELTSYGWVDADDSTGSLRLTLTDEGLATYRKARHTQEETRERVVEGLSEEDYAFVIRGLERMLANVEGAAAELTTPGPSPDGPRDPAR